MESMKKTALYAGLLYLVVVIFGPFVLIYVPGKIFVRGDATATVQNILNHEFLFRISIWIGIVSQLCFIGVILLLYRLLKEVRREYAMLMVLLILFDTPSAFMSMGNQVATLSFVQRNEFLGMFDKPQQDALAILLMNVDKQGVFVSEVLWGLWLFPLGVLVVRSGFLPRFVGVWLIHSRINLYLLDSMKEGVLRTLFLVTLLLSFCGTASATALDLPAVVHYKLNAQFQLKNKRVSILATLTIRNITDQSHTQLPFLLYRLLTVKQVSDRTGTPLRFNQDIGQLRDAPSLQAREVIVNLRSPLRPDDTVTVVLEYDGFIFGYPEVMAYVNDRIDENYSLLRPDAFAYPILSRPTFASSLAANDTKFTYEVTATVPTDYRVACGGELVDSQIGSKNSTFVFRSKIPTWRIDIAVAKFTVLSNPTDQLVVYHLPEDSMGARIVMNASRDVIKLYNKMFGQPESFKGYSIIEIPDGWGSQASDYYFLQTAAAFKDSARISEAYHEIGHSWNATPSSDVQRCRYFDEAFASFFEALAIRAFSGETAFEEDMEKSRDLFVRWAEYDRQVFETPIVGYGAKELGRHSYTKGAWSLYVLYRLVGENTFGSIIRTMLTEFKGRVINFQEFQKLCERVAGRDLRSFFQEWIYGTESSQLLVQKLSIDDIVKRY